MENATPTPVSQDTDDLEQFELAFNGGAKFITEVEEPEGEVAGNDTPALEVETEETEEPEDLVDEDEDPSKIKLIPKKKLSAQERINDITAKYRAEERERLELQRKYEEAVAKLNTPTPVETPKAQAEPIPDDEVNGEAKYPLGEFDPGYIRDLAKFTIAQERDQMRREEEVSRQQRETEQAHAQLQQTWNTRVAQAETELPDLRDKVTVLQPILSTVNEDFGNYLSTTIMSLDNGPEILYYLSDNPDEARRIVASGPTSATLALGRLDALLSKPKEPKPTRVTQSPPPPLTRTKGASAAVTTPDDTDDLHSFEKKFYGR